MSSEKTEEHRRGKTKWTRKGKEKEKKIGESQPFGGWRREGGDHERRNGPGSYGII